MARASKICSTPGCPELQPCSTHSVASWTGSTRRQRTGSGWQQQRDAQRLMRLHGGICHVCLRPGADEIDHVIPLAEGGADDDSNRRPIHSEPCHREKTAAEAARARSH